ncbi:hypothetical protein F0P96_06730 [Hymenobacter busanensis]|uniref:Uncharacterized protein n=1 Tax=Hymenobacter busanensis TaxID=2607656 RepID=A0A7L5A4J0_9BACT|nr:hypothetical protein [Hymenobacter busanensis]KAA9338522.1 hypothetical protein F0P96_06730 [Hymenobacter busanensis]QHJ09050.1 hypothetical protein GUY19_17870 [Hymenobacter busanensis]
MLVSLVIYVCFRSQKTIVNQVLQLVGIRPALWRLTHARWLVYNLPGALWLYAFLWFSSLPGRKLLYLLPLSMALGIELLQLLHITDGTFDPLDVAFYGLAGLAFAASQHLTTPWTLPVFRTATRARLYRLTWVSFVAVVLLSDVWVR